MAVAIAGSFPHPHGGNSLLAENRISLMTAVMAGFGAIISEVGAAMMVGGNLTLNGEPYTATLTTATVLAANMGDAGLGHRAGHHPAFYHHGIDHLMTLLQQRSQASAGVGVYKAEHVARSTNW